MRHLESKNKSKKAVVFLGKVGVGISEQNLKQGEFSKYDRVFLILDNEDEYDGEATILPEHTSVTVRFCGSHGEAYEYYRRLISFINTNDMQITGFSSEITMIDYAYTSDLDKFVTEIQIPVTTPNLK